MPWLRSGTVSCTQNSTTVTGTNTGFAANARVGDAFLGPDGRWYEVANVASDTVLSILPSYQGASTSAGTYALAPMQGYVKDSADALRALVNKFGSLAAAASINALAVLTGTADSIPYFTAADTMALIRLTSSQTDATAGRIVKVGDFGVGAQVSPACPVTSLNDLQMNGTFRLGTNNTDGPFGAARGGDIVISSMWNAGGTWYQQYIGVDNTLFWRKNKGSWSVIGQGVAEIAGLVPTYVSGTSIQFSPGMASLPDGTRIWVQNTITLSSQTPATNTWYYAYLYLTAAGVPAIEFVTTAPAGFSGGRAYYKSGDASRRFLCAFRSSPSANTWLPFRWGYDGFIYYISAVNAAPCRALVTSVGSMPTGYTAVSLAAVVPPTTLVCKCLVTANFGSSTGDVYFGNTDTGNLIRYATWNTSSNVRHEMSLVLNSAQGFSYMGTNASGGVVVDCIAYGADR